MNQSLILRLIQSKNNLGLWTLVFIIYAFYIWGHVPVSNICYALSDQYTANIYRYYVLLAGKILLGVFIFILAWLLAKTNHRLVKTAVWLLFAAGLFFSYDTLIIITIEYVHFIQYCLLTVLLCKIFASRQYLAILLALLAGYFDEVYQAYPDKPLNWRDIMLNVTGVLWGWLFFWTLKDVVWSKKANY